MKYVGVSGVMFLAAAISLIGAVFSFFCIPRTKNKSMYELELLFVKKTKGRRGSKDIVKVKGFDLFDKDSILTAEKKVNNIFNSEWIGERRNRKRKSVWF